MRYGEWRPSAIMPITLPLTRSERDWTNYERFARDKCCAVMCAEAVWWRCHRRIIADYLAEGVPVAHIMGHNKIDRAKPTPSVRSLPSGTLIYLAGAGEVKAIV